MAANTMDAIKKKMQAMKLEKENAMEKSDEMEQKLQEQKDANEKVRAILSKWNTNLTFTASLLANVCFDPLRVCER